MHPAPRALSGATQRLRPDAARLLWGAGGAAEGLQGSLHRCVAVAGPAVGEGSARKCGEGAAESPASSRQWGRCWDTAGGGTRAQGGLTPPRGGCSTVRTGLAPSSRLERS